MKIKNVKNMESFFVAIEKCKGSVELITPEGDRLNLKSKLCQYFSMAHMFNDTKINDIEIICSEPDDIMLLMEYLIRD